MRDDALGDSDEANVIKPFLRCLINLFQVLMSIFMTKTAPSKEVINDHIKLFMSSAHYLHKQHGTLDTSEKERNTKTPTKKPVDCLRIRRQPRSTLEAMLAFLSKNIQGGSPQMVNRVNAVTMADTKPKLATLGHTQVRSKIVGSYTLLLPFLKHGHSFQK